MNVAALAAVTQESRVAANKVDGRIRPAQVGAPAALRLISYA